jgi:hypothetical protein
MQANFQYSPKLFLRSFLRILDTLTYLYTCRGSFELLFLYHHTIRMKMNYSLDFGFMLLNQTNLSENAIIP